MTLSGRGKIVRRFDRGYYRVKHLGTGDSVEFCVTEPKISCRVENGKVTVQADACDPQSKILHMEFREKRKGGTGVKSAENENVVYYSASCASLSKVEELTETEKETGTFIREIPEDAFHFKIYFENAYGVWTHTMIPLYE